MEGIYHLIIQWNSKSNLFGAIKPFTFMLIPKLVLVLVWNSNGGRAWRCLIDSMLFLFQFMLKYLQVALESIFFQFHFRNTLLYFLKIKNIFNIFIVNIKQLFALCMEELYECRYTRIYIKSSVFAVFFIRITIFYNSDRHDIIPLGSLSYALRIYLTYFITIYFYPI